MSDLIYNEIDLNGKSYKYGDWKAYAVHSEEEVRGFFGDYRWLSNFYECNVYFEGLLYPSSENAYQAAKLIPLARDYIKNVSAVEAKKQWKKYTYLDNNAEEWDNRKYEVMSVILFDKFYRNKDLRNKLIETGEMYLEELNHWRDTYWGVDIKLGGENNLGKILMKIREYWK